MKMLRLVLFLLPAAVALAAPSRPWVENRLVYNDNLPHSRDALADDRDYFPDDFLSSVADCGMNGVWMWVKWRDVVETSFAPRPADGARRLEKLRSIAKKCRRHGLSLWVFGIEPAHFTADDPLFAAHPELAGAYFPLPRWYMWCPSSPAALRYAQEAARDLFTQVPELGGLLNIAFGESTTTCMDGLLDSRCFSDEKWHIGVKCERCDKREVWELYADMSAAIVRGIRQAGGKQPYLAWFYQATEFPERNSWNYDCAAHSPDGATFVYNFESGVLVKDRGKFRCGGDYWLSQPGPSAPFRSAAAAAFSAGRRIGAKIQTCNSHELATLPYIPAPGLLYRKYRQMRHCGVRDVVQSWFFGSAPSLMLKAAGMLSCEDFSDGEEAFLQRLASSVWGADLAPAAVKTWKAFSDAFARYPVDNKMGYYGPFHTGIAWPYHPEISCTGLPRSWWPNEPAAGDMIGECLGTYTLDEVEASAAEMAHKVRSLPALDELAASADSSMSGDIVVMKAFRLQLLAAHSVLRFYRLRRDAVAASFRDRAESLRLLGLMGQTVRDARLFAEQILPLAEVDDRIGFHAEAAKRNYDPDSLRNQIADLCGVEKRLRKIAEGIQGGNPWPVAERECAAPGEDIRGDGVVWRYGADDAGNFIVEGLADAGVDRLDVVFSDLAGSLAPVVARVKSPGAVSSANDYVSGVVDAARGGARSFRIVVDAALWGNDFTRRPAWFLIARPSKEKPSQMAAAWPADPAPVRCRLFQPSVMPERYGRLSWFDKRSEGK